MRLLRVILPVLVLGIMVLAPATALAADPTFFGPIIPPECECPKSAPDFGCVMSTIQNGVNFAISIGVIIFVLVSAYAGLLWMMSPINAHNREQGRTVLINAVIGLLIMLGAWLMVDFVMGALYNPATTDGKGKAFGPWHSILGEDVTEDDYCLAVVTPPKGVTQYGDGGITAATTTMPSTQVIPNSATENSVRAQLSAANITVNNKNACPAGETYQHYQRRTGLRCTTVGGLTSATISQAIEMSKKWGGFQISGGSEGGHATHSGGNRFDATGGIGTKIRTLPAATAAQIQASQIKAGTTGVYADSCGNTYFDEGDHWHVTVFKICSSLPS